MIGFYHGCADGGFDWNTRQLLELFWPSVLWRCWLGVMKGIQPVKIWLMRCLRGYLLERSANSLHMVQLMLLPPHHIYYYYYNCFTTICPGLPRCVGTRRINHSEFCWSRQDYDFSLLSFPSPSITFSPPPLPYFLFSSSPLHFSLFPFSPFYHTSSAYHGVCVCACESVSVTNPCFTKTAKVNVALRKLRHTIAQGF